MLNIFNIGDRVAIADGVLQGEPATIVANPENGEHFDDGCYWIKFNRDNARLGREKGNAILSQQWFEAERLTAI